MNDYKYVRLRGPPYIHTCRSYTWPASCTNRPGHGPRALICGTTSLGCVICVVANEHTIGRFVRFWASGGAKFHKMGDSLPWTPTNRHAKFDATSFILCKVIRNRTNTHTKRHSKRYTSTPCLSACVDNNQSINRYQWSCVDIWHIVTCWWYSDCDRCTDTLHNNSSNDDNSFSASQTIVFTTIT